MADHVQQQILEAIVAALKGATRAADRVHLDRVDPLPSDSPGIQRLPAVLIEEAAEGDNVTEFDVHGRDRRDFFVIVRGHIKKEDTYARDARAFGLELEKVLAADVPLKTLCRLGVRLTNSRIVLSGEAETAQAAREQRWQFSYVVRRTAPDVANG